MTGCVFQVNKMKYGMFEEQKEWKHRLKAQINRGQYLALNKKAENNDFSGSMERFNQ